ncbi:hypothetical protein K503DRAFT_794000 [Rhizopogon vinicolor AM-OR11-026]|uniref:Uncharacterized protein n=1 Tax=Rhizopogon vinicolor AM-OR11-026 TaxID=1314800 RepID=A0A1B7MQP0_9AGAM|nr:hypothetical protein K503DRAFT_794000 [Rhizopogon vinicolor AM-OR11-026]
MPFEIKTGRSIAGMEHRAQTMLYTLLAAERYGSEEVVPLIGARNEMAAYMMRRNTHGKEQEIEEPFLPPTIDDERLCKKCYVLDTCMLFRKAVENVIDISSPIADLYDLKTSHLRPSHLTFFKQWEKLISLEEQDAVRFKKELWCMTAQEREDKGRCFNSMVIDTSFQPCEVLSGGKRRHYTYCFVRGSDVQDVSFLNGHMIFGDAITVSVEADLALAQVFILELTPKAVVVSVDHELSVDKIEGRLRTLREARTRVIFRIDEDELSGCIGRIRDNLVQLLYTEGDARCIELVVDLRRPLFDDEDTTADDLQRIPEYVLASSGINLSELAVMKRALSARDYALILGIPGTGKTTVITALIRTIVAMGKRRRIPIVDTILLKLQDADFGILRLSNVDKVHLHVRKFTLSERRLPTMVEELENQIITPPVVATTCLTIDQSRNSQIRMVHFPREERTAGIDDIKQLRQQVAEGDARRERGGETDAKVQVNKDEETSAKPQGTFRHYAALRGTQ